MSVSASIDISILKNNIYNFSAKDLIAIMINNNWDVKKKIKSVICLWETIYLSGLKKIFLIRS